MKVDSMLNLITALGSSRSTCSNIQYLADPHTFIYLSISSKHQNNSVRYCAILHGPAGTSKAVPWPGATLWTVRYCAKLCGMTKDMLALQHRLRLTAMERGTIRWYIATAWFTKAAYLICQGYTDSSGALSKLQSSGMWITSWCLHLSKTVDQSRRTRDERN